MITVVEVKKNGNENNMNLLRRFGRKVIEAGIIKKVKSKRYNERAQSKVKTKLATLKRINRKKAQAKLEKMGKAPKEKVRGGHR